MSRWLGVLLATAFCSTSAAARADDENVQIEIAPVSSPPAPPPPRPVQTQAQSPGLIVGGGVALVFGGLSTLTGVVLLPVGLGIHASRDCNTFNGQTVCEHNSGKGIAIAGGITLAAGLVLVAGSVVMIVIGAQQVPKPVTTAYTRVLQTGALEWSF